MEVKSFEEHHFELAVRYKIVPNEDPKVQVPFLLLSSGQTINARIADKLQEIEKSQNLNENILSTSS